LRGSTATELSCANPGLNPGFASVQGPEKGLASEMRLVCTLTGAASTGSVATTAEATNNAKLQLHNRASRKLLPLLDPNAVATPPRVCSGDPAFSLARLQTPAPGFPAAVGHCQSLLARLLNQPC
jgi:hypothetical protein